MNLLSVYEELPFAGEMMHLVHFLLCGFAVLIACLPLLTEKGSEEHKFGGMLYVPVSTAALGLACIIAWKEQSLLLFCFNAFCAYLLLSGWRAMHAKDRPALIDWMLPGALFLIASIVALRALTHEDGMRNLYMLFFALNAYFLVWRDWEHLKARVFWRQYQKFMPDFAVAKPGAEWLDRHLTGMIGSLIANLSVVVLTLLPFQLHWLWAATLVAASLVVAARHRQRKSRLEKTLAPVLRPDFARGKAQQPVKDSPVRRAA